MVGVGEVVDVGEKGAGGGIAKVVGQEAVAFLMPSANWTDLNSFVVEALTYLSPGVLASSN